MTYDRLHLVLLSAAILLASCYAHDSGARMAVVSDRAQQLGERCSRNVIVDHSANSAGGFACVPHPERPHECHCMDIELFMLKFQALQRGGDTEI